MGTPRKANPQQAGRKAKYKAEYCQALIDHMAGGYNFKSFGAMCDPVASVASLYRWLEKYPAFREAKDKGEVLLERWGISSLKAMGMGQVTVVVKSTPVLDAAGKPVMDPKRPGKVLVIEEREVAKVQPSAHIFLLKNMLKWSDRQDVRVSGDPSAPVTHEHKHRVMTREERLEEIERLRQQRETCGDD